MSDPTDAALDSWINWLEDLPLPKDFDEGVTGLQSFITALRTERDAALAKCFQLIEIAKTAQGLVDQAQRQVDVLLPLPDAAYARGVHAAAQKLPELFAEWESDTTFGLDDMCRIYFPNAIRALADAPPVPVVTQETVLKAAGQEYVLDHNLETSEERMGRHSAVRGMMVRLGLYGELEAAIDAALALAPPAPVVGVKPLVWIRHPTAEVWRCDTLIGTYKIFAVKHPVSWDFDGLDNEGISLSTSKMAQSHEAAKAAAQSDYEARILAALLPKAGGGDA